MATQSLGDIKSKNETELVREVAEFRRRLSDLKIDLAAGKVKNVHEIKTVKRAIARMLTILRSRRTK